MLYRLSYLAIAINPNITHIIHSYITAYKLLSICIYVVNTLLLILKYQATDYVLARAEEPPHMLPPLYMVNPNKPTSAVSKRILSPHILNVELKINDKSRPGLEPGTSGLTLQRSTDYT